MAKTHWKNFNNSFCHFCQFDKWAIRSVKSNEWFRFFKTAKIRQWWPFFFYIWWKNGWEFRIKIQIIIIDKKQLNHNEVLCLNSEQKINNFFRRLTWLFVSLFVCYFDKQSKCKLKWIFNNIFQTQTSVWWHVHFVENQNINGFIKLFNIKNHEFFFLIFNSRKIL